jgi:DNA invertase Pin-like site-specific DNA recombinase
MTVPAVFYGRMSSDRQEYSIPDQRSAVLAYAAKQGYAVIREYLDEGISGDATERRFEFQRMIRDAREQRDFRAVLCWDQDRFGRFDPIEAGFWIKPLRDAGVYLDTVAQGRIEWDTFGGRLLYSVRQEGKHQYLVDLSHNALRRMIANAQHGGWNGGPPPYGYVSVEMPGRPPGAKKWPKMLAPGAPRHVEVVRWLFRTYATRDVSLRWLGGELERRGVLTHRGRTFWSAATIRGILTRREYVGDLDWGNYPEGRYHNHRGGEIHPRDRAARPARLRLGPEDLVIVCGAHEPLVDRDLWEAVRAKLAGNQKNTTPHRGGGDLLLTRLLVCGNCGSPMSGTYGKSAVSRARYYVCGGFLRHGLRCCHNAHRVSEAAMTRLLVHKLQDEFLCPENLDALREEIRRQAEAARQGRPRRVREIRGRIADLTGKIDGGMDLLPGLPADLRDDMVTKIQGWKGQQERALAELAAAEAGPDVAAMEREVEEAERQLWRLREAWAEADPAQLRAVLREHVDRVALYYECRQHGSRWKCQLAHGVIYLREDVRIPKLVKGDRPPLYGSRGSG